MKEIPLLRNSERSDFKRCPQRWWWRWKENLVPIEMSHGPLVFGTFGHLALAEWYAPPGAKDGFARGPHPAETWDKITKDYVDSVRNETTGYLDDELEITWDDARLLGHDMLVNYVDEYGNDDHWSVLWAEKPFEQYIPSPASLKRKRLGQGELEPFVRYVGTIDLVVRDLEADRIRYIDHKFMKTIETQHLWIDDQNGGYLAIGTHQLRQAGLIGEKEAVRDLIYNFLRKARYPEKGRNAFGEWLNKDGSVSKRQPTPFFERCVVERTGAERNSQIVRIGEEAEVMAAFSSGQLPLYKSPKRDCRWDCSFFTLCNVDESGGNVAETKKALYRVENPYTEYEDQTSSSPKRLERE